MAASGFVTVVDSFLKTSATSNAVLYCFNADTDSLNAKKPSRMFDKVYNTTICSSSGNDVVSALYDMNSDGKADVFIRRQSGENLLLLNRSVGNSLEFDTIPLLMKDYYYFQGVRDMNADGQLDIIFRNSSYLAYCLMDFNKSKPEIKDTIFFNPPIAFSYYDLNADGKDDMLYGSSKIIGGKDLCGMFFHLNKSTSNINFDTLQFLPFFNNGYCGVSAFVDYTDSGTVIYAVRFNLDSVMLIDIGKDTNGLNYKNLQVVKFESIAKLAMFDFNSDNRNELLNTRNKSTSILRVNGNRLDSFSHLYSTTVPSPQNSFATAFSDSSFFMVGNNSNNNLTTAFLIDYRNDTIKSMVIDTFPVISEGQFADMNGDGLLDLVEMRNYRLGYVFFNISKTQRIKKQEETLYFVADSLLGSEIDSILLVNLGLVDFKIDSFSLPPYFSVQGVNRDSIQFPFYIPKNDSLYIKVIYKPLDKTRVNGYVYAYGKGEKYRFNYLRGKVVDQKPFVIKHFSPHYAVPGDTIKIITSGFGGTLPYSLVYVGTSKAKIIDIRSDTIYFITPAHFRRSRLQLMDSQKKLVAISNSYLTLGFDRLIDQRPVPNNYVATTEYNLKLDQGYSQIDYLVNNIFGVTQSIPLTNYYKPVMGINKYTLAKSETQFLGNNPAFYTDLNMDGMLDEVFYNWFNQLVLTHNLASDSSGFPFIRDTVGIKKLGDISLPNYLEDLDNDGLLDFVYRKDGKYYFHNQHFDSLEYDFERQYQIADKKTGRYHFVDVNQDGYKDFLILDDTSISYYQNTSRQGKIKFKFINDLKTDFGNPSFVKNMDHILGDLDNDEISEIAFVNHTDSLYLARMTIENDKLKLSLIDQIRIPPPASKTTKERKLHFEDVDANGLTDILVNSFYTQVLLNAPDTAGLHFDSSIQIKVNGDISFFDLDSDNLEEIIYGNTVFQNQQIHINIYSKVEWLSLLTGRLPYEIEPTVLYAENKDSFSKIETIWVENPGNSPVLLESIQGSDDIKVSDSMNMSNPKFPLQINSRDTIKLYLRFNKNLTKYGISDTLTFKFNNYQHPISKEIKIRLKNPPQIDSITPTMASPGDTLIIFGSNFRNHNPSLSVVRIDHTPAEIVMGSDTLLKVIVPKKIARGYVTVVDTINHLRAQSGQLFYPVFKGKGGKINPNYFYIDTIFRRKVVSYDQGNAWPTTELQLIDLDYNGKLDLIGMKYGATSLSLDAYLDLCLIKDEYSLTKPLFLGSGIVASKNKPRYRPGNIHGNGFVDFLFLDYGSPCNSNPGYCTNGTAVTNGSHIIDYEKSAIQSRFLYPYSNRYDQRGGATNTQGDFNGDGITETVYRTDSSFIFESYSDEYLVEHYTQSYGTGVLLDVVHSTKDTILGLPKFSGTLESVDIDGDNRIDIVDGGIIYLNKSTKDSFIFEPHTDLFDSITACKGSVAYTIPFFIADLNNDRKVDFMLKDVNFCSMSDSSMTVFVNESSPGKIKFKKKEAIFGWKLIDQLYSADFNGDGLLDIYTQGRRNSKNLCDSLFMFTNRTDSVMKFEVSVFKHHSFFSIVEPKDINGDMRPDIALYSTENDTQKIIYLLNQDLAAAFSNNHVAFATPIGSQESKVVYFKNTGGEAFMIDSITKSSHNPHLSISVSGNNFGKQSMTYDESLSFTIKFDSRTIGTINDTIWIHTNFSKKAFLLSIEATTLPWPKLLSDADTIYFGKVAVNDSLVIPYTIYNVGSDTLYISSQTNIVPNFIKRGFIKNIIPHNDSLTGYIAFIPARKAQQSTTEFIYHNALSQKISLTFFGDGISPVITNKILRNLDSIRTGTWKRDSFFIYNTGNDTLKITSVTASSKLKSFTFPNVILGGDSGLISYEATSDSIGNFSETLRINHNYYEDTQTLVSVVYTGIQSRILTSTQLLDFGWLKEGDSLNKSIRVYNKGSDTLNLYSVDVGRDVSYNLAKTYTFPIGLAPGDSTDIDIRFKSRSRAVVFSELVIFHNAKGGSSTINLVGSLLFDLGKQKVKQNQTQSIWIVNSRSTVTRISDAYFYNTKFVLSGFTQKNINAFDSIQGNLVYKPDRLQKDSSEGRVESYYPRHELKAIGEGISPKVVQYINRSLPMVKVDTHEVYNLYLYNTGTDTLFIKNIDTSQRIGLLYYEKAILPSDSGKIQFKYFANSLNTHNEWMKISHNYYEYDTTYVSLTYKGLEPRIFVSTTKLDFGDVWVNKNKTDSFYVKNNGNDSLRISEIKIAGSGNFGTSVKNQIVIAHNELRFISVDYNPTDDSSDQAILTIYHNAKSGSSTLDLKGRGVTPKIDSLIIVDTVYATVGSTKTFEIILRNYGNGSLRIDSVKSSNGIFSIISAPQIISPYSFGKLVIEGSPADAIFYPDRILLFHNYSRYGISEMQLTLKGTDGYGAFNPHVLDFGARSLAKIATKTFYMLNFGEDTLQLGYTFVKSGSEFSLATVTNGRKIAPGDSISLMAEFLPKNLSLVQDTIWFWSDSKTWKPNNYIVVKGEGVTGKLLVNTPVNFGMVKYLHFGKRNLTIENIGGDTLRILSLKFVSGSKFSVGFDGDSIMPPNDKEVLNLTFDADQLRNYSSDSLIIHTTAYQDFDSVLIDAETIWPILEFADSFSFGKVLINTKPEKEFTIFNSGTDTLQIDSLSFIAANVFGHSESSLDIFPSDSQKVKLVFSPVVLGYQFDSLNFYSNDPIRKNSVLVTGLSVDNLAVWNVPVVKSLQLFQNTPNPVYGKTIIGFYLPEAGDTKLLLYDQTGKLVRTLLDGKAVQGWGMVEQDFKDLDAGMYYYSIYFENEKLTKTMIFIPQ